MIYSYPILSSFFIQHSSPTNVDLLSSSEKYGGDFDFMIYRPFFKHSLDYSLLMDISYFRMIFQLKRQIS